ncbi:hypothetical protein [Streptomyces marispadix]|uniref:Uncharacterized protein n=1 Tax=Streptomyces marispadix TaxID=2922868 RepID=A0ABS9T0J0_9ACTN|nr:hypothetical protein [Streptomyces marispadix]MCH6162027.1 hypothetical protein [Streptomyces marispadix]
MSTVLKSCEPRADRPHVECVLDAEPDPVEAAFDRLAVEHPEACTCSEEGVRS